MTTPVPAAPDVLVSWMNTTDFAVATHLMDTLVPWLDQTYLRYCGAELPACWAWHPDVVEELWWLRGAWLDAYTGQHASWAAIGTWHEHHRPGVVRRISELRCQISAHVAEAGPGHPRLYVPLASAIPRIVGAWATPGRQNWPGAAPTSDDVHAADTYNHAKHTRRDTRRR
jgi:hypothetical protein